MLIGDLLKNSAKKFPEKIAVVLGQKELSFKELNEKSNKVANALLDANLPKAKNLAILSATPWIGALAL